MRMVRRRALTAAMPRPALFAASILVAPGCGARSELPEPRPPPPGCAVPRAVTPTPPASLELKALPVPAAGLAGVVAITGDAQGEILVAGGLMAGGTIDFGGGERSAGSFAAGFLAKFDASGGYLWDRVYDNAVWSQVLVDAAGRIAAAGFLNGTDFSGRPLSTEENDFVAELDSGGDVLWSKTVVPMAPSPGRGPRVSAIGEHGDLAIDRCGDVLVSGWSHPEAPAPDAHGRGLFVTKYDPSGSVIWSTSGLDPEAFATPDALPAADAEGNTFLAMDTGDYLAKLDRAGHPLWTKRAWLTPPLISLAEEMGVDAVGNVAVGMAYQGPFDLDTVHLPDPGQLAFAVIRFDPQGNAVSAAPLSFDPASMSVDGSGTVLLAGSGPDPADAVTVEELDPMGRAVWSWSPPVSGPEETFAVGFDRRGYPLLAALVPTQSLFIAFAPGGP
jgi:hypothetical protein